MGKVFLGRSASGDIVVTQFVSVGFKAWCLHWRLDLITSPYQCLWWSFDAALNNFCEFRRTLNFRLITATSVQIWPIVTLRLDKTARSSRIHCDHDFLGELRNVWLIQPLRLPDENFLLHKHLCCTEANETNFLKPRQKKLKLSPWLSCMQIGVPDTSQCFSNLQKKV